MENAFGGESISIRTHVLIVDDDRGIREALRVTLTGAEFAVSEAATGEQALQLTGQSHYDVILLDINLPGMGGMNTCRELRRRSPWLPIVMLTVRDSVEDKISAFEAGADDYVVKPFHTSELAARVRAVVRRTRGNQDISSSEIPDEPRTTVAIGEIAFDSVRRFVTVSGRRVHLTPKEFDLLHYLMQHAGEAIAHGRLLSAVWGPEYSREVEYLRTFVRQLRRKIEKDPANPQYLLTDAWYGYRFRDPAEPTGSGATAAI